MRYIIAGFLLLFVSIHGSASDSYASDNCPSWFKHDFRQLHSNNVINFCEHVKNKPVLIVNTASHCGFTHQLSGLEKIHQRYKNKNLVVVGFSSNDFNQEAATEKKTADICYINFGVKFTMMAPISVKGESAHPFFKALAERSQEPSWNFSKYLISADRSEVQYLPTTVSPESKKLRSAIEALL
jgi:glutathione peroxidase